MSLKVVSYYWILIHIAIPFLNIFYQPIISNNSPQFLYRSSKFPARHFITIPICLSDRSGAALHKYALMSLPWGALPQSNQYQIAPMEYMSLLQSLNFGFSCNAVKSSLFEYNIYRQWFHPLPLTTALFYTHPAHLSIRFLSSSHLSP